MFRTRIRFVSTLPRQAGHSSRSMTSAAIIVMQPPKSDAALFGIRPANSSLSATRERAIPRRFTFSPCLSAMLSDSTFEPKKAGRHFFTCDCLVVHENEGGTRGF